MATKDLYRKARTELLNRGLHKGDLVDPEEGVKVCALGACAVASGIEVVEHHDAGWIDYDGEVVAPYTWYSLKSGEDSSERSIHKAFPELAQAAEELFPDRVEAGWVPHEFHKVPAVNDNDDTTIEDVELIFNRAEELAPEGN
jgi:hypothetical protein